MRYFSIYLQGRPFQLHTDHNALKWILGQKDLTGRLARWVVTIQSFMFNVTHIPGKENLIPYILSLLPHHTREGDNLDDMLDINIMFQQNTTYQLMPIQTPTTTPRYKRAKMVLKFSEELDKIAETFEFEEPQLRKEQLKDTFCAAMIKFLEQQELPKTKPTLTKVLRLEVMYFTVRGILFHWYKNKTPDFAAKGSQV